MSAPATQPTNLAAIHVQLLRAFLSAKLDLVSIAAAFALTLPELASWFHSEPTQTDLNALRDLARERAQILSELNLPAAVETLNRINANLAALQPGAEEPIATHLRLADSARRTATAIHRLATPRAIPIRAIGIPADVGSDRPSADHNEAVHLTRKTSLHPAPPPVRARDRPAQAVAA